MGTEGGRCRYYFIVALHYDIAVMVWSILIVYTWQQLYDEWVYSSDDSTNVLQKINVYGYNLLQVCSVISAVMDVVRTVLSNIQELVHDQWKYARHVRFRIVWYTLAYPGLLQSISWAFWKDTGYCPGYY